MPKQHRIIELIIEALKQKPNLVVIFGICVLGFFATMGIAALGNIPAEQLPFYLGAFLCFLLGGLGSAIIMAKGIRPPPPRPLDQIQPPELRIDGFGPFESDLKPILERLRQAARFRNEVFLSEVQREFHSFGDNADHWSQGRISVPPLRYNEVLLRMYETARASVFCTSFREYRSTWQSQLGNLILKAHEKADAKVTRVFIFDTFEEIIQEDVDAMLLQSKVKSIEALVFIDKEYPLFDFPPDVTRDFTIIDGSAVGITSTFGQNKLAADWYFANEAKVKNLEHIKASVIKGSNDFKSFLDRWTTHQNK